MHERHTSLFPFKQVNIPHILGASFGFCRPKPPPPTHPPLKKVRCKKTKRTGPAATIGDPSTTIDDPSITICDPLTTVGGKPLFFLYSVTAII